MLDTGLIEPTDVDSIHEAQSASQIVRLDALYGHIVLKRGYAKKADLSRAFQKQREMEYKVRVGELLVNWGTLSSVQHRQVLSELLSSVASEERAYMSRLRLKRRVAPGPNQEDLSELEKLRADVVGEGAPESTLRVPETEVKGLIEADPLPSAEAPQAPDKPRPGKTADLSAEPGGPFADGLRSSTPVMGSAILDPVDVAPGGPPLDLRGGAPPSDAALDALAESVDDGPLPLRVQSGDEFQQSSAELLLESDEGPLLGNSGDAGFSASSPELILDDDDPLFSSGSLAGAALPTHSSSDPEMSASGEIPSPGSVRISSSAADLEPISGGDDPAAHTDSALHFFDETLRSIREEAKGSDLRPLTEPSIPIAEIPLPSDPGESSEGESRGSGEDLLALSPDIEEPSNDAEDLDPKAALKAARARMLKRRGVRPVRRISKTSERSVRAHRARLLESAIETLAETEARSIQRGDVKALEGDLQDADQLVRKGYRSFHALKHRSSDASRVSSFSTDQYLRKKRQRRLALQLTVAGVLLFLVLPLGLGTIFAYRNQRAVVAAETALSEKRYEDAAREAEAAGSFWVGADRVSALRREVQFQRVTEPVRALLAERSYLEAQTRLRDVMAKTPVDHPGLGPLEAELQRLAALERGERFEGQGDLSGAVAAFEAARGSTERPGEAEARIDAIRNNLLSSMNTAEAALARNRADELALETFVRSGRRYEEVFADRTDEIHEKISRYEFDRYVALGEQAEAEKSFEQARLHYERASDAASKLNRTDAVADLSERLLRVTRLGSFQTYFNEGQRLHLAGRYGQAVQAYERAKDWIQPGSTRELLVNARIEESKSAQKNQETSQRSQELWTEAVDALKASQIDQAIAALERLVRDPDGADDRARRALRFAESVRGMVYVPGGRTVIGTPDRSNAAASPPYTARVPSFFMDRYEVKNRDYQRFLIEDGREAPSHWTTPGPEGRRTYPPERSEHPAINVSWLEADAFARWIKKRLPLEEQWERAARGDDGRTFPWGEEESGKRVNLSANVSDLAPIGTVPVGTSSDDESPFGIFDLGGNVSEWTDSPYMPYPEQEPGATDFDAARKVLKGGSWRYGARHARSFNRERAETSRRYPDLGFRLVQDVPEWLEELR
ncbi:MAG: formylglycine-generating enzyme family protein [Planctomycetota bacterium]